MWKSKEIFTKAETKEMLEKLADLMRLANKKTKTDMFPIDYFVMLNQYYKQVRE